MKVKWSRDFSIKNMQLDKQHELIFEITNLANDLAPYCLSFITPYLLSHLVKTKISNLSQI